MSKSPSPEPREPLPSSTSWPGESNGTVAMDDLESTMATAYFVEQLHANMSSQHEKELITARVLDIARARKDARTLLGSHGQAMPLFISILRSGTPVAKVNVAATLSVLCKDEELRLKVLLGGCIPPLLSLLKSASTEARKAASEAIYEVSSGGLSDDHVGMKIFVTEGVVPTLWDQLNPKNKQDKVIEGFVTGALINLFGDEDGYWRVTIEAGGVDIIMGLLSSDNVVAQSNAASLLARLMLAFSDSIPKVIDSGAVKALLRLVGRENDISVRASAADALEVLSSKSTGAKKAIVDAKGVPVLIGVLVAPPKECMQGKCGQALQGHATRALANICGGMYALILYLGELSHSPRLAAPISDIVGALDYTLMAFKSRSLTKPPYFDGTNYGYWKMKMVIFLDSHDNGIWEIVENGSHKIVDDKGVEKLRSTWTPAEKKLNTINMKAMDALYCALSPEEFSRILECKSAQEIWHTLEITYEGTNRVKESKIQILMSKYEAFKMKPSENITQMFTRFANIVNEMNSLGRVIYNADLVKKVLRSLPSKAWRPKVTAIEECKDLNKMPMDELLGSLMTYELSLIADEEEEEKSSDSESDEEFAHFVFLMKKFLKKGGRKFFDKHREDSSSKKDYYKKDHSRRDSSKKENLKSKIICYKCKKPGHMKAECSLYKKKERSSQGHSNTK